MVLSRKEGHEREKGQSLHVDSNDLSHCCLVETESAKCRAVTIAEDVSRDKGKDMETEIPRRDAVTRLDLPVVLQHQLLL